MERLPRGIYSPELRDQAVRLYQEEQTTLPELAKRLSILKGTLKNWVTAARAGKLSELGKHQKPLTDIELELTKVKRELTEVKMERDLLKKCAAYFARTST
jgi:transposase